MDETWEAYQWGLLSLANRRGAVKDSSENAIPSDDPLGENPFPQDDPRHQGWVTVSRWAKEQLALFYSKLASRQPAEAATSEEHLVWLLDGVAGQFDILAQAFSVLMPWTEEGAKAYEQALDYIEEPMLETTSKSCPSFIPKDVYSRETRMRLWQRKQHWTGCMLKQVREAKDKRAEVAARPDNSPHPTVEDLDRGKAEFQAQDWADVEISFFSEHSVQITAGRTKANRQYGELGMGNQRTGRANLAWHTLHQLALSNGTIYRPAGKSRDWGTVEKRMQELRVWLRARFGIASDPLPFVKGAGYQAQFKIKCAASYQR